MTGWYRRPDRLAGRCSLFCRAYRRWLLLFMALGLLLCWDASIFPGCLSIEGCGRFFSSGKTGANVHKQQDPVQDRREHFRRAAESQSNARFYTKDPKPSSFERRYIIDNFEKKRNPIDVEKGDNIREVFVLATVSFNDTVLLILNPLLIENGLKGQGNDYAQLKCVFSEKVQTRVLLADQGSIRCEHPPFLSQKSLNGSMVTLSIDGRIQSSHALYGQFSWRKVVYGLVLLEEENDALLFVKGLVGSKKGIPPKGMHCLFGETVKTEVVAFCQENFRCRLPPLAHRADLFGRVVTLIAKDKPFPSVVRFFPSTGSDNPVTPQSLPMVSKMKAPAESKFQWKQEEEEKTYHVCACTMVWNGAKFLREWIMYHSFIGVQRFFVYDNNSDDDLLSISESLEAYNVSRHMWPWIKTQEAGFSHCSIRAASECAWVLFIDLDEFVFPKHFLPPQVNDTVKPPLHALIQHYDSADMGKLGQLKISCFNFGPSGLVSLPKSGQIVNYICRMKAPKRVKSIVRTGAMNVTFCSRVHHFELKRSFVSARALKGDVVIQHYKYQVWEDFKQKFVRRVATFVTDWQEKKDINSFDRTPGLGTEAVEPIDWAYQFCEVEDTGLRDYVLNSSRFQNAGKLLWE